MALEFRAVLEETADAISLEERRPCQAEDSNKQMSWTQLPLCEFSQVCFTGGPGLLICNAVTELRWLGGVSAS